MDALRATGAPIGITLNLNPMRPHGRGDEAAAARMDAHQNRWFLDPVLRGTYPTELLEHYERVFGPLPALNPEDMDVISRPIDFLGVNYYNPTYVRESAGGAAAGRDRARRAGTTTAMGWPVDASGLHDLLLRLRADYGDLEIWITENGAAFDDETLVDGVVEDPSRVAYLSDHLDGAAARGRRRRRRRAATTRGRCWTTSSGSTATTSASGSCAWTTPPRSGSRSGRALWYRDHIASVRGVAV